MKFAGVEWVADGAQPVNGWSSWRHPKKPVTMLTRGDGERRFIVRGQVYTSWTNARRFA